MVRPVTLVEVEDMRWGENFGDFSFPPAAEIARPLAFMTGSELNRVR